MHPSEVGWAKWPVVISVLSAAGKQGRTSDYVLPQWRVKETDILSECYQPKRTEEQMNIS